MAAMNKAKEAISKSIDKQNEQVDEKHLNNQIKKGI